MSYLTPHPAPRRCRPAIFMRFACLFFAGGLLPSMTMPHTSHAATFFSAEPYGSLPNGQKIERYTLRNKAGLSVQFISYGGIITAIDVPDRHGSFSNIALGFPDLEGYVVKDAQANICFGALIGRYANRIANGTFTLDGVRVQTTRNTPPNTLHGGANGFHKKLWHVRHLMGLPHATGAELTLTSPDGDEGFPGTLHVSVRYILDDTNRLTLQYRATTDKPTVVNLTNHTYFNLNGEGSGSVENHHLHINADHFTPTDAASIPTGKLADVSNTPFDFRTAHSIGQHLRDTNPQLLAAHGYDQNWAINGYDGKTLRPAATLTDPASGRVLTVLTTLPGLQVYTANGLNGAYAGTSGRIYRQTDAVALETQFYPDAPNHPNFPSATLRPGVVYTHTTVFAFGTDSTTQTP
ncbi:aldose epimerase family protein [Acetobacter orientalis]|uniref:aldose epimerase family protein n=1 Tax=Acetobacter orientalis TaxID=146474 RepID=UPI0039E950AF